MPNILLLSSRVSSPKINRFQRWTKRQSRSEFILLRNYERPNLLYVYCTSLQIVGLTRSYHGGGFVLGDIDREDGTYLDRDKTLITALCRAICSETNSIIANVGYRHAPEFPYPMPVEDAYSAALWVP